MWRRITETFGVEPMQTLDQCVWGQPFSTVRATQGRMIDYFLLPDGRRLHPYRILEQLPPGGDNWIRQYQLPQDRPDHIVIQVPARALTAGMQDLIGRSIAPLLGAGVDFQVHLVDVIPQGPSGTYRHSQSLVRPNYGPSRS